MAADWSECRVDLPAPHNWLVLDLRNEDPEAWAREIADEHPAEARRPELYDAFATDVRPLHGTALECRLLWSSPGLGEALVKTADELAESLRLT